MNKIILAIAFGGLVSLTACKKEAGSGGTSSIKGTVTGRTYTNSSGNSAEQEITQITLPDGSDVEDGEYILLNTPSGGTLYYVWFKWNSGVQPDPALSGRTGIQVTFDFNQSNTTVANNTASAITAAVGSDFTVSINNDIITLTNSTTGEVADADELTANILIDIANQGQGATSGGSSFIDGPIVDERVYLKYGEEDFYSESVRTDAQGNYQFKELNRGDYKVFVFSNDTLNPNGPMIEVEVTASIANKKEVVEAPSIFIYD